MIRHILTITFRNFKRNKTSFYINLIGLSTGLACALLILGWVWDEVSMDKFHEQDEQLFQVVQTFNRKSGVRTRAITPAYFAQQMKETMPEVKYATAVNNEYFFTEEGIIIHEGKSAKAKPIFAGTDYFNIFSFPLLHGDKDQVLKHKTNVVISESLSNTIFKSTEDVVGKMLKWEHDVFEGEYIISGIFKDLPSNSTEQFDIVLNFELALDQYEESRNWSTDAARTFFILKEGASLKETNKKLTTAIHSKPYRETSTMFAQKFSTRYLHGQYENGEIVGGRIIYVKLFSLIALFLLVIACVNFINLSTAKASTRMKEVGVRKTTGASKEILIAQFLGESVIMVALSTVIALLFISLFLPQFNAITEKQLNLSLNGEIVFALIGIVLFTGLLAGTYPAFYLSAFNPAKIFKGKRQISFGEKWIRKGLVIFQFSLSLIFIVGFLIINQQIDFINQKQLGYEKDNIISFVSKGTASNDLTSFMQQLENVPGVLHATNILGGSFIENKNRGTAPLWEGADPTLRLLVPRPHVGYGYIETLGIKLKEGRSFSKEYTDEESKVIVNEKAVELMGLDNPIGSILRRGETELQIIGIVEDFHNESLHKTISPTFIRFLPEGKDIMVKIKAGEEVATIQRLKKAYEAFHNGFSFEFVFLDEAYQDMYNSEKQMAVLSNYFAGTAILVSCLGLFGLAMFTAERRKKEIGIRKVLGSSVFGIVQMLTGDFTKTIITAIAIALPISYFIAKSWLANFAYTITMESWFFIVPAIAVLVVAWCTVGIQTFKAALMNPIYSLKEE